MSPERTRKRLAPQVGLEPTTLRLTAGCSAIELLRSVVGRLGIAARSDCTANHIEAPASLKTASPVTIVCPFPSPAARREDPDRSPLPLPAAPPPIPRSICSSLSRAAAHWRPPPGKTHGGRGSEPLPPPPRGYSRGYVRGFDLPLATCYKDPFRADFRPGTGFLFRVLPGANLNPTRPSSALLFMSCSGSVFGTPACALPPPLA